LALLFLGSVQNYALTANPDIGPDNGPENRRCLTEIKHKLDLFA
jgi:hypothetical protein